MAAAYSVQLGQFSPAKARNVLGWGRREKLSSMGKRQTSTAMFISRRERERLAKGEQKLSRKERERRLAEAQESAGAAAGQDLAASPGALCHTRTHESTHTHLIPINTVHHS